MRDKWAQYPAGSGAVRAGSPAIPAPLPTGEPVPPDFGPEYPPLESVRVYARELVTGITEGLISTGHSAWYGLQRYTIGDSIAECGLVRVDAALSACDEDGTATPSSGTASAWGDLSGNAAAVVIGRSLPNHRVGDWYSAPALIPGIESASNLRSNQGDPGRYLQVLSFPTGSYTDSAGAPKAYLSRLFPGAHWFERGDTLDVAFVMRGSQYVTSRVYVMHVDLTLTVIPRFPTHRWARL